MVANLSTRWEIRTEFNKAADARLSTLRNPTLEKLPAAAAVAAALRANAEAVSVIRAQSSQHRYTTRLSPFSQVKSYNLIFAVFIF